MLSSALFNLSFNKKKETTYLRRDDSDSELQGLADHQTPATLVLVDNSFTNVFFPFKAQLSLLLRRFNGKKKNKKKKSLVACYEPAVVTFFFLILETGGMTHPGVAFTGI